MDIESAKRKYARVLVEIGTGLKPGQALCVQAPVEATDFVPLIAQAAYDMGCSEFGVIWTHAANRLKALWETVLRCVYCDMEDPVAEWRAYIQKTAARKAALDKKGYTAFHYKSAVTDLTLYPVPGQIWMGGFIPIPNRPFTPNIPTQEVFNTPIANRSEGYVTATLPLNWGGGIIHDIYLRFEGGKVVEYRASQGQELLTAMLSANEGALRLGEMALVDQDSPIARMGRLFYTTLYDENASCHIALGNAYGPGDPELRRQRGYNDSSIHVDLMIGSDDLNIRGLTPDGRWEDVFIQGRWASGLFYEV